jgi:hypothetical protein
MDIKKLIIISLIFLILAGILFRFLSISKDITGEETDFVNPAKAFQETGQTNYYHSEQQPSRTGLLHPPMYILTLSLALSNSSIEESARSVSVLASLLTAVLIYLSCINFIKNKNNKIIGLLATAIFLINYYSLSMALTIDIDAFSTLFTFAFVFFILMFNKSRNKSYLWPAGVSLFFSIFNRYPIAFLVFVSLGAYYFINKDLRKNFKTYFLVGLFAGIAFFAVWAFYSTFIEPGTFFSFFIHNAQLGSENLSSLKVYAGSFIINISQFFRLFTLPVVILMILSFFHFIKTKDKFIKINLIYSLSILFFFIFIPRPAFGYPRYFMSLIPGFCIVIAMYLDNNLNKIKNISNKIPLFAVAFVLSLLFLLIASPQGTFYQSNGLIRATNLPDFVFNLFASFPLVFAFFVKDKKQTAIIILCILALSYVIYFDIGYLNHDSYTKETGLYIKEHTNSSDLVICPKAVGFYTQRRYYVNDLTKPPINNISYSFLLEYFKKSLEDRDMSNEFFWEKGYFGGINLIYNEGVTPQRPSQEIINTAVYVVLYHPVDNIAPEKKIGSFYIYRLSS